MSRTFANASLFFLALMLHHCDEPQVGVDQAFIEDQFELEGNSNPTILNIDESGVCPKLELDSGNDTSFFVRITEGSPVDEISEFSYATVAYGAEDGYEIIQGENSSGSIFSITYNPTLRTYTIDVDYNCNGITDTGDCTNTEYSCVGPQIEE